MAVVQPSTVTLLFIAYYYNMFTLKRAAHLCIKTITGYDDNIFGTVIDCLFLRLKLIVTLRALTAMRYVTLYTRYFYMYFKYCLFRRRKMSVK